MFLMLSHAACHSMHRVQIKSRTNHDAVDNAALNELVYQNIIDTIIVMGDELNARAKREKLIYSIKIAMVFGASVFVAWRLTKP